MQTKQTKLQSPSPATKAAEPAQKAAHSVGASTRLPAWTSTWGNQPPAGLVDTKGDRKDKAEQAIESGDQEPGQSVKSTQVAVRAKSGKAATSDAQESEQPVGGREPQKEADKKKKTTDAPEDAAVSEVSAEGKSPAPFASAPAVQPKEANPHADPRFQAVMVKLDKSAIKTSQHSPPKEKVAAAHAAAVPPANEKLAGAQAKQVDVMKEANVKKPDPDSFLTLLRTKITEVMPKKLGQTETFMKGDQKQQLENTMTGNVNQQKQEATGGIKSATSQAPDSSKVEGKEVTPLPAETTPTPSAVGAANAMPERKDESEVSLKQSKQEADQSLKTANVTPEQLKKANDPRFSAVLTAKTAVDKQANTAPQKYRADEQKVITQTAAKAVSDEKQGLTVLHMQRGKADASVTQGQMDAKGKDEKARKDVVDNIEKLYSETKKIVEDKLNSLETDVSTMFDKDIEDAMTRMTNYVNNRMAEYKEKRYSGLDGAARWIADLFVDLPDEVNAFYDEGLKVFRQELDTLIVKIADTVETRLKEAKDEINNGQKRISEYVKGLDKSLQNVGQAAEKEIVGRFDEMRQSVDDKKNELADKLAQRYKEAYDKAGEKLKEMQAENKGLLTALEEKLGEVVKILTEFKERILGMLKTGKETIDLIVADPIGFLKNLLAAIKKGLDQFFANIWTHLKAGFMAWLFGSLADAGIVLPQDFSLGSILKLVFQILGLTYERIRAKAVKIIGERNVKLIEKAWQFIYTLITGGPEALWEQIKEFLGNLKEMVVDAIQNWVVTTVIKAAITKLATMFNPVGAIVQAIITIYNTVMFFIERINQILDFVQSIINSVHKIAVGDIDSAAGWIEKSLAKTIPLIISFLADLLGLGGISEKIKSIIEKVQNTVDKAVDKVIEKIVSGIKRLFGGKKDEKPDDRTPEQKQADLDKAMAEAGELVKDKKMSDKQIKKQLLNIKSKYKMISIELVTDSKSESKEIVHVEGAINPSGKTSSEEKDIWPPKVTIIKSVVGKPPGRKKSPQYEKLMYRGIEVGLPGWERAHSQGQGTGVEDPRAIFYAPEEVNQELQNRGIEKFIRDLYKEKPSDVTLLLTTETQAHSGTLRLASIFYKLEGERQGEKQLILEVWIEVENKRENPKVTFGVGELGAGVQAFLDSALHD